MLNWIEKCQRGCRLPGLTLAVLCLGLIAESRAISTAAGAVPIARQQDPATTVLRGSVKFDDQASPLADGTVPKIKFADFKASLREIVTLPPPPFPDDYDQRTIEQQLAWQREFAATEAGQEIIARNRKLLEDADVFEIDFDKLGKFTVYDVPAGEYGIRGRVVQEVGGQQFAFEISGQLQVTADVDELNLAPMTIVITPLLTRGSDAPPIDVGNHDGSEKLTLDDFKDRVLLVNFWTTANPTAAADQRRIQQAYQSLRPETGLGLLSINVDANPQETVAFLTQHEILDGSHGFTGGREHPVLRQYGIRGVPSYWLIGRDGKIMMTQAEFARAMSQQADLNKIVSDRIAGRDKPSPAEPDGNSN